MGLLRPFNGKASLEKMNRESLHCHFFAHSLGHDPVTYRDSKNELLDPCMYFVSVRDEFGYFSSLCHQKFGDHDSLYMIECARTLRFALVI